jgi:hypothetical protein
MATNEARLLWFSQFRDDNRMKHCKTLVEPLLSTRAKGYGHDSGVSCKAIEEQHCNKKSKHRLDNQKAANLLK